MFRGRESSEDDRKRPLNDPQEKTDQMGYCTGVEGRNCIRLNSSPAATDARKGCRNTVFVIVMVLVAGQVNWMASDNRDKVFILPCPKVEIPVPSWDVTRLAGKFLVTAELFTLRTIFPPHVVPAGAIDPLGPDRGASIAIG